jgi:small subunit ribosomal protein S33
VENPQQLRTGHRILRERLAGPRLTSYHPTPAPTVKQLNEALQPTGMHLLDMNEVLRLNKLASLKARGKGAPKKGTILCI